MKDHYPDDIANIEYVRDQTHIEIIERLCHYYKATFYDQGAEYHYILAKHMYYFLACGYARCLIKFLSSYIYKNRNELYNELKLNDAKKNKDTATVYNKKIYKDDQNLAIIIANIDKVVGTVLANEITFEEIIRFIFIDESIVEIICNSFKFENEFYLYYRDTMNGPNKPVIVSNIILQLQSYYNLKSVNSLVDD